MKKILAFVFSLVLTLSMLCCCAVAEAVDITGEWYADLYGMTLTLTLADGAYTMDFAGDAEEGTYTFDGTTIYMDEGTDAEVQMPYDAEKNVFVLDMGDGMIVEFGREPVAAFVPAEARIDSTIEEFAGEWSATQVSAFGMIAPVDVMELYMTAKIEGSAVTMSIEMMGDVDEFTVEGTMSDGVLTVIEAGTEGITEDITYTMQLLEDGTMAATFEMLDEAITFYMEPAAAEEAAE